MTLSVHPPLARRRLLCLATAGLVLAGCASLTGPRVIEVPYARLQAGLERRFPVQHRLMELFDLELTRPRLLPSSQPDRLGLALDAGISSPFARERWRGNVSLSGRLALDPVRQAVVLAEPRIEGLEIEGMDGRRREQVSRLINALAAQLISELPLYSFHDADLRYAGVQFTPTRLETRPDGLALTVEPLRR